jgi:hypothetical protein
MKSFVARKHAAFLALLLFAVAAAWLGRAGAFQAGFDGNHDEAAHVMTGVLIRDYVLSGTQVPAVQYAERYYVAYPKIAFGVWPPLFHLVEGAWFLLFEPSRLSAALLMAALLAATALVYYLSAADEMGRRLAAMSAVLLVSLPAVVQAFSVIIADSLLVLLVAAAGWSFQRYLARPHWKHALAFGAFAGLAFLTKYNAMLLIFVPPVAIAVTGRWQLWRKASLWLAPVVVVLIAVPWYLTHPGQVAYAADMGALGFPTMLAAGRENLYLLLDFLGLVALVSAVGLVSWFRDRQPAGAVHFSLLLGTWLMHSFVYPIVDARYLLPAVPSLIYFLGRGVVELGQIAQGSLVPLPVARAALLAVFAVAVCARPADRTTRPWSALAGQVHQLATTNTLLVSGSGREEGALVAEIALRDPQRHRQPSWLVLRASKVLADSSWMGANYRLRLRTAQEVRTALTDWRVSIVAIDPAHRTPHAELLLAAVQGGPTWREHPSAVSGVRLFTRDVPPGSARTAVELDLSHTIGRKIVY